MSDAHTENTSPKVKGGRLSRWLRNWRQSVRARFGKGTFAFVSHPEPQTYGNANAGAQMLSGNFRFAGKLIEAPNLAIWSIEPPSKGFERALQAFDWMDDLAALGTMDARRTIQEWVFSWQTLYGNGKGPGWKPDLVGRRLIRLCTNGVFLLKDLRADQSREVFRLLGRHVHYLEQSWKSARPGLPRMEALAGLIYAGLSLEEMGFVCERAAKAIGAECESRIDETGGIASRNPEELMEIFILLTWSAKSLREDGFEVDARHLAAIERLAPVLRGLRLGDGKLVRFHGGDSGDVQRLDQAFADAHVRSSAKDRGAMGFERLAESGVVVVIDADKPARSDHDSYPYRSVLSFEMSSHRCPIIVNCGPGKIFGEEWDRACRSTPAHSGLVLGSKSLGDETAATVTNVRVKHSQDLSGNWVSITHDRYRKIFGQHHERRIFVRSDGASVTGEDILSPDPSIDRTGPAATAGQNYALHFHVHPEVSASLDLGGQAVSLRLSNGEVWVFRQDGGMLNLESSVYLDRNHLKPRATKQIVVSARSVEYSGAVSWSFDRITEAKRTPAPS